MRLLKTSSLNFEEFANLTLSPPYAILSHTWGKEEVLFKDIENGTGHLKEGYKKVTAFCELVASVGYEYCWIDTCCIDKSSSAELSEAINSMFSYYEQSQLCCVYLDIAVECVPFTEEDLHGARWTRRGWTLQELIAPRCLSFYDKYWRFCGERRAQAEILQEVTGIDQRILKRDLDHDPNLSSFSIATRMSWAAWRETTRAEDMAYCLFGIFGVHLAPLYGEGPRRAFERLQEEIIKTSTDLSFLAWDVRDDGYRQNGSLGARWSGMATGPKDFRNASCIVKNRISRLEPFHVTNKGLCVTLPLVRQTLHEGDVVILTDCFQGGPDTPVGIRIFLDDPEDNFYYRSDCIPPSVCKVTDSMFEEARMQTFYIATRDIPDQKPRGREGYN